MDIHGGAHQHAVHVARERVHLVHSCVGGVENARRATRPEIAQRVGRGKAGTRRNPSKKRLAHAALPFGNYPEGLGAARLLSDHPGAVDLGEDVVP
jgi:hypothetical protein